MTTSAYPFYAYWNGEQVSDLWTTIAALTSTQDYRTLLICVAVFGFLSVMIGAAVRYRGQDAITWFAATIVLFSVAFVPRVNINVLDVRGGYTQVINDVPIGIGWPASTISRVSYWLTQTFETAFNDVDATSYTRFGMAFPQRVVTSVLSVKPITEYGRVSLVNFSERCVVPEILDNPTKRQALMTTPDIYALISSDGWVNPARRVMIGDKVLSCSEALKTLYDALHNHELPALESMLVNQLSLNADDVVSGSVRAAIPNAESVMLGVSRSLTESLRQSVMMAAIPQATMNTAAKAGQAPLSAAVAMARAQGNLASEINYRTLSEMAKSALPKLRNLLEFIVIGLFPITFLLAIGLGTSGIVVIRAYFTLLISVSLWAPITSIMNYLMIHVDAEPLNRLVDAAGGVTLAAATMIRDGGATSQAMAGSLMWLVPVLAYAVAKGSDMALTSMASSVLSPASSAAQAQGSALAAGNVSAGNASLSNVSTNNVNANKTDLGSSYTSPNQHTTHTPYGDWSADRSTANVTAMRVASTDLGVTASGTYQKNAGTSEQSAVQDVQQHQQQGGKAQQTQVQAAKGIESTTVEQTGWQDTKSNVDNRNVTNGLSAADTVSHGGNESLSHGGQAKEDFGVGNLFRYSTTSNSGNFENLKPKDEVTDGFRVRDDSKNLQATNDLINSITSSAIPTATQAKGANNNKVDPINKDLFNIGAYMDGSFNGSTNSSKTEGTNNEFRTGFMKGITENRAKTDGNTLSKGTTTTDGKNSQLSDKHSASLTKGNTAENRTTDSLGNNITDGKSYQATEQNGIQTQVQFSNMVRDRAMTKFGSASDALESLNQSFSARYEFGQEIDQLNKALDQLTGDIQNNIPKPATQLPKGNEQELEKQYEAEKRPVDETYRYSASLRDEERWVDFDGVGNLNPVTRDELNAQYLTRGLNMLASDQYFRDQTSASSTVMRAYLSELMYESPDKIFNQLREKASTDKDFANEVIRIGKNQSPDFSSKK